MTGSAPYVKLLTCIPAFAALDPARQQAIYQACSLKVLAKGEAASIAGAAVEELAIIVSGHLVRREAGAPEAGPGAAIEARAFFTRGAAEATAIALRETVLLTLAWDDLIGALQAGASFLQELLKQITLAPPIAASALAKPSRLVIAPAGSLRRLDPAIREVLLAGFESVAEIRLLGRGSFGAGMPGAISLDAPETAHWLQELELEFDVTVTIADEMDADFAMDAIAEASEIVFVACGGDVTPSALETYARDVRGAHNCRLLLAKGGSIKNAAQWLAPRPYRSAQAIDFSSEDSVRVMAAGLLGKGNAAVTVSRGAYAAAILGALQALEHNGQPPVCLVAAGSAILPAGLLACGVARAVIEEIFSELANPLLWKRASRTEAGIYDPAPLDHFLSGALKGLEIQTAGRLFAALSHSLSTGLPEVQRHGRLYSAVRAGIAPAGILPPLVLDNGTILVSGENGTKALVTAATSLTSSPIAWLHAMPPPLGASPMSYRSLTSVSQFRLLQSSPAADKRLRLETLLGTAPYASAAPAGIPSFAIPLPEGIMPMDWQEWARLRDAAYDWLSKELETGHLASDINSAS